jgi:formylglycine-generating enzyme required for sulfatase activity
MLIGIFLGMGCSLVMVLSANILGVIEFSGLNDNTEGETPAVVVTNTPDIIPSPDLSSTNPDNTTTIALPATFTPDPNGGIQPTPTMTLLPGGADVGATTQSEPPKGSTTGVTTSGTPAVGTQPVDLTQSAVGVPTSAVPTDLQIIASVLLPVDGGVFKMGTTLQEGQQAVAECISRDAGTCVDAMIVDSTPPHDVTLTPFQIEQTEVSVGQYVAFLNYLVDQGVSASPHRSYCNGPCILTTADTGFENSDIEFVDGRYRPRGQGTDLDRAGYPVTLVTWYGAQAYCQALGRYLPTEAQWERAARGPQNLIYPWGQQWIAENANTSRSGLEGISPVNEYDLGGSGYGALNMAGNVAEWTRDWYNANYYANSEPANPLGPPTGDKKVVRGGGWDNVPLFARTVHRSDQWGPTDVSFNVGFRCAADQ